MEGDKRPLIICLNSVLMALSAIAIVTRLLTRTFLIKHVGSDDVLIIIALILALALSALYMLSTKYGEGLHIQHLEPQNVPQYTQVLLCQGLFYSLCQMFVKLSYLALYLRLAPTATYRVVLYISMALISAFGISTSIASVLLCIPFDKLWHPDLPGNCIDINPFYITSTSLNMVFDIAVYVLPIPILWNLQLPKRQRIGLAVVFSLGLIALVASVVRLKALINLLFAPAYRSDNTWDTVDSINWSSVEIHLGLLLSCTATYKVLIQRFLPGFLGSSNRTNSQNRFTSNMGAGSYALQSRSRNEPNLKPAARAHITEVDDTGSQEHIIADLEMVGFETTESIHSPSKASTDGGAIVDHSAAVVAST